MSPFPAASEVPFGEGSSSPEGDSGPVLELRDLVKCYGSFTAVDGVELTVERGEIVGFVGPNGAGKTTTIRMVAGILTPTGGTIRVRGCDLASSPEQAKRLVGYIPDRPFIYEKLSGAEFLRFVAALWGRDGPEVEERIDRFLDLFLLKEWKDQLVESYSHGMRQKLLISSALIHDPALIVVDEPMVGLDPRSARLLKDLLRTFVAGGGSVFLSTHTLEIAEAVCDRIAIISSGRIIASGSMEELRAQADAGGAHLEEIFLKVTGGQETADLVAELKQVMQR